MISIPRPCDDAKETFRTVAARTKKADLRAALLAVSDRVAERADEYLQLGANELFYRLAAEAPSGVSKADLADIYDRVLVRGKGRPIYDRLRGSAKFRRCPLCGTRDVRTLDHYLSKSEYPELAVFPANLVPSCSDCSRIKLDHAPTSHAEQTFHPYFDDWSSHRILRAIVTVDNTVNVSFSIQRVAGVQQARIIRAQQHFDILQLSTLYASNAAVELVESKDTFRRNFDSGGAAVLKSELEYTAGSRQRGNLNGWSTALYWALAASANFVNGGFEQIEE